jgi:hypothetical protein
MAVSFAAQEKTIFLALAQRIGCPILRAIGEGWDATALHPRPFPATSAYPTLRRKREGWGTRSFAPGQETLGEPQADGDKAEAVLFSDRFLT